MYQNKVTEQIFTFHVEQNCIGRNKKIQFVYLAKPSSRQCPMSGQKLTQTNCNWTSKTLLFLFYWLEKAHALSVLFTHCMNVPRCHNVSYVILSNQSLTEGLHDPSFSANSKITENSNKKTLIWWQMKYQNERILYRN